MKLLLISPLPPPVGGIASWTVNLLLYKKSIDSDIEIIHQNSAIRIGKITNEGILMRFFSGILNSILIILKFLWKVLTNKIDLIHLTSSGGFALIKDISIVNLCRIINKPIVVHFRFGRIPSIIRKKNWEWYLLNQVIKKSTKIIVLDYASFNVLKSLGFEKIRLIPNPVSLELEELANLNKEKRCNSDSKILFVGHVISSKGVYELVSACSKLSQVNELNIIGPYENNVKKELMTIANHRENGQWIQFHGSLSKKEVIDIMVRSTIFVLPSYTEGFPNVILEAMAAECPIIASNVGAIPEMLQVNSNYPCGICIEPKNETAIINSISLLLNDSFRMKKLVLNGRKKVNTDYSMSKIYNQYLHVWQSSIRKES